MNLPTDRAELIYFSSKTKDLAVKLVPKRGLKQALQDRAVLRREGSYWSPKAWATFLMKERRRLGCRDKTRINCLLNPSVERGACSGIIRHTRENRGRYGVQVQRLG
jgi:hypothetical protein